MCYHRSCFVLWWCPRAVSHRRKRPGLCVFDDSGRCVPGNGECMCYKGWTGQDCGSLDLLPVPTPTAGPPGVSYGTLPSANTTGLATWGGSLIQDPGTGVYHLFAAEISLGCGLDAWFRNSVMCGRFPFCFPFCFGAPPRLTGLRTLHSPVFTPRPRAQLGPSRGLPSCCRHSHTNRPSYRSTRQVLPFGSKPLSQLCSP